MLGYLKTHDKNSLKLYDIDRILAIALSIGTTYDETKRLFDIYCGFNLDGENNIAKIFFIFPRCVERNACDGIYDLTISSRQLNKIRRKKRWS